MTVVLPKGGNVLLSDEAPGIEGIRIGLGWSDGPGAATVELDGVVIVVEGAAPCSRVLLAHQVPNPTERLGTPPPPARPLTGDAEKLVVTLAAVPAEVSRLQFGAVIYNAAARRQTFQSVRGAYIRLLNHADSREIVRYTLEAETGRETAMIFGEIYRHPKGWKFRAIGQGYTAGLAGVAGAGGRDIAAAHPVDVAGFLTRTSRAQTRRNVADYLHPQPMGTPEAAPVKAPSPPPRPAPQRPAPRPVPRTGPASAPARPPV
ncbi:MAG: TerD family protein, partial [Frankia sp.]